MAKRRKAKKATFAGGRHKKRVGPRKMRAHPTSNHVPLMVLEKRLTKLNRVVKSRGGDAF